MNSSIDTIIETVFGSSWMSLSDESRASVNKLLGWILKSSVPDTAAVRDKKIISALQLSCIEVFGQTMDELLVKEKRQSTVEKRYMLFCTARDLSTSSGSDVARLFPQKDRAVILYHARQKLNDLCDIDKRTEALYNLFHSTTEEYLKIFTNESNNSN